MIKPDEPASDGEENEGDLIKAKGKPAKKSKVKLPEDPSEQKEALKAGLEKRLKRSVRQEKRNVLDK